MRANNKLPGNASRSGWQYRVIRSLSWFQAAL